MRKETITKYIFWRKQGKKEKTCERTIADSAPNIWAKDWSSASRPPASS